MPDSPDMAARSEVVFDDSFDVKESIEDIFFEEVDPVGDKALRLACGVSMRCVGYIKNIG